MSIRILEFQSQIDNSSNYQQRIIQCRSWVDYLNSLLCDQKVQISSPSIPRNSRINEILDISNDHIVCKYKHWKIGWVIHHGFVLPDDDLEP